MRHYLDRTNHDRKSKNSRLCLCRIKKGTRERSQDTLISWLNATIWVYLNSSPDDTNLEPSNSTQESYEHMAQPWLLIHTIISSVNAAQWRASGTFGQFYYRDNPSMLEGISSLGPIVAGHIVTKPSSFNKSRAHCQSTGTAHSTVKVSAKTLQQ